MLGQTIAANMKLVDAAVNSGDFNAAQIATSAGFHLRFGCRRAGALQCAGLNVESCRDEERAECEGADSGAENGFVLMFLGEGGWNEGQPKQHHEAAAD